MLRPDCLLYVFDRVAHEPPCGTIAVALAQPQHIFEVICKGQGPVITLLTLVGEFGSGNDEFRFFATAIDREQGTIGPMHLPLPVVAGVNGKFFWFRHCSFSSSVRHFEPKGTSIPNIP